MTGRHTDDGQIKAEQAGLTPTEQVAATGPTLRAGEHTVTELWRALFDHQEIRDQFIRDVRAFVDGRDVAAVYDALDERDVPVWLRSWILSVGRGDRRAAWRLAADLAPGVGDVPTGGVDALLATADLFGTADEPPTPVVSVVVDDTFQERRRDQRTDVCRLLATLADGVRVRVVASGLTRRWLADAHRADLPGVSEWCNGPRHDGPVSAVVGDALDALDADGTAVEILRLLADEPGETLAYGGLYGKPVLPSDSAVRQSLGTLADLELVARYGPDADRRVELTAAGRAYLDRLAADDEPGSTGVSDTPKFHQQAVLSRARSEGGKDGQAAAAPGDGPRPYRTRFLNRSDHAAAAGTAASGGVTLLSDRLSDPRDTADRTRFVSVDDERGEVVAAVRATGALHHMVSSALALASPRVLDRVITDKRLSGVDEPPAILRDARCVGALSEGVLDDAEALREAFVEWGEELASMTTDLKRGEYDDRDRFRGEILRTAHGLAGSLAHLFDVVGYDVVREVRVPGGLDAKRHTGLARSLAVATAIQSKYGAFATYRQLFEQRDDKRESAFSPEVDAADPMGRLIGSVVVRGPDVHRFRPHLEDALASPGEVVDDAPEFQVPVSVERAGRDATSRVARRVLATKQIRATPEAVSLLDGIVGSPYDVARALHELGQEERTREVRPDEIRYALSTLPADALLPDHPPTLGRVVTALLRADGRLTQREVADRADVSTQSVRTHRDRLVALGLVEEHTDGPGEAVRLALSFGTPEGETRATYPGICTGETAFAHVLDGVAAEVVSRDTYLGPVYDALAFPPDPWSLRDKGDLRPWVELAARLADVEPPGEERTTVAFGAELRQVPISGEVEAVGRV